MDVHGIGYILIAVLGPLLLVGAVTFAILRGRATRVSARTEAATRDVYADADADAKARGDD